MYVAAVKGHWWDTRQKKICFLVILWCHFIWERGRKEKGKRKKRDQREKMIFNIAFLDSNFLWQLTSVIPLWPYQDKS